MILQTQVAILNDRAPLRPPPICCAPTSHTTPFEYLLILENVLTSHLVLLLDDFRQREEGLYFGERNLTSSGHLGRGIQHTQNVLLDGGQRLLGMESSVQETLGKRSEDCEMQTPHTADQGSSIFSLRGLQDSYH